MKSESTSPSQHRDKVSVTPPLAVMIEIIEHAIDLEMEKDASPANLATTAVIALCRVLGGSTVYLPKNSALKKKARDDAVFKDYKGSMSIRDIVKKHRISSQAVYKIIERKRCSSKKAHGGES